MARRHSSSSRPPTDRLVGASPAINGLRQHILHLAAFDTVGNPHVPTLLLHGETGTGKGLIARVIHDSGPRAPGPFVEVNCAAIPETMLEAELFGFEAGAFTDAKRGKPGLFEAAAGGTLFLDEIDALSLALQSKLLTAVEEKRVRRLGGVVSQAVDIKLIAATQVDLSAAAQAGRFRADLYHRLAVILLEVPPLRERGADIVLLAQHLLQQFAMAHRLPVKQLSAGAAAWLQRYPWPGNVRELRHLMERVTLLCRDTVIEPAMLAQWSLSGSPMITVFASQPVAAEMGSLNEPERMREALRRTGGNVSRAAKLLGWSRKALRYRLQRHGLKPQVALYAPASWGPEMASSLDCQAPPSGRVPSEAQPEIPPQNETTPDDRRPASSGWEQRTVAVLVIDLTQPRAASSSAVAAWERLRRWEDAIAEKIQECGGVFLQRSPPFLVAAFGLLQALEQMPHRAVHAALTIRHLREDQQLTAGLEAGPELRQAVHLGPVLVEVGAPDPVMRLPAVGDTLAVPMRLIGHTAPGEILASTQAGRLLGGAFALQAREVPLAGEHHVAVTAYAVTGRRPPPMLPEGLTARPRSRFVGRERELAMLHELLAEVEAGRGQVVGVVGEPGMGKSRLLWEFRRSLGSRQVRYLECHCFAFARATPYLPMLDILRQQAEITEVDRPEVIVAKVRHHLQAMGMDPEASAPPLFQLLGLQEGLEPLAGLTPQALKARTFEMLSQWLFGTSQQQPLVLAIEDLHWIDPTSDEFLASWVERLAATQTMLLCTYRPGYQPPWLYKSYTTQLALKPLSRHDSRRVLQSVLATEALSEALTQTILSKAEGNPFFLEELAYTVNVQQPQHAGLALPETIQGVLMAQIDALPAGPKRLLQTLAVIGKPCPASWLTQILDQPTDALHGHLATLQHGEFIDELPARPESKYRVKHTLIQDVAYEAQGLERQQEQHRRIAQAIEALGPDHLPEYAGELAYHYQRSGDTARAVFYHQQAGQWALQRSAFGEAVSHFTTAIEHLRTLPNTPRRTQQELDLWIALGRALLATQGPGAAEGE